MTLTSSNPRVLKLVEAAARRFDSVPDHPFASNPEAFVLRRPDNGKWFALFMNVARKRMRLDGEGRVDLVNFKCDPLLYDSLIRTPGVCPPYHMARGRWISVLLDGSAEDELIDALMAQSFRLTGPVRGKSAGAPIHQWIIPSNPKMWDIETEFARRDETMWTQSSRVHVGDAVYIYVGAPYSAIRYRCRALAVDLPSPWAAPDEAARRPKKAMRLKVLKKYDRDAIDRAVMAAHGVTNVRGPRSMPEGLLGEIRRRYPEDEI